MTSLILRLTFTSVFLLSFMAKTQSESTQTKTATFAGGCFWCMEPPYDGLPGVESVIPGYMGGHLENPTYEQVSAGTTGHAEVVQIQFDPRLITYDQLLDVFWRNIDPTTLNQQFADMGTQYRTAIFYHSDQQKKSAEASRDIRQKSGKFGRNIVTEISAASHFYPAEEYHQQFYKKNPLRYNSYKAGSGRKGYLERLWGEEEK
jgi:methionine-S-sulfoxide reductase